MLPLQYSHVDLDICWHRVYLVTNSTGILSEDFMIELKITGCGGESAHALALRINVKCW